MTFFRVCDKYTRQLSDSCKQLVKLFSSSAVQLKSLTCSFLIEQLGNFFNFSQLANISSFSASSQFTFLNIKNLSFSIIFLKSRLMTEISKAFYFSKLFCIIFKRFTIVSYLMSGGVFVTIIAMLSRSSSLNSDSLKVQRKLNRGFFHGFILLFVFFYQTKSKKPTFLYFQNIQFWVNFCSRAVHFLVQGAKLQEGTSRIPNY